jgi:D-aspartate ligase
MSALRLPPAVILGGGANAVSIARALGKQGVPVYAINTPATPLRRSRCCRWIPLRIEGSSESAWERYLCGSASDALRGAVLLAACDEGIEIILRNREALSRKFILDISSTEAQAAMLDKLRTYRHAEAAGVATPRFRVARDRRDVLAAHGELTYPLIVKPRLSHAFQRSFEGKHIEVRSLAAALAAVEQVRAAGLEVMLVEKIPGPDSLLCSYYTYLDESGTPLFDFTKRVVRRYPAHMGEACAHVTDWNPEARDEALKLFRSAGLLGLANAEFKRDPRDGKLKLIECNARFTAANGLVAAAGLDLASFVYFRLIGQPRPLPATYRKGLGLVHPTNDVRAFLALREAGQLSFRDWAQSLARPQVFPYFDWHDPGPSLLPMLQGAGRFLVRRARSLAGEAHP